MPGKQVYEFRGFMSKRAGALGKAYNATTAATAGSYAATGINSAPSRALELANTGLAVGSLVRPAGSAAKKIPSAVRAIPGAIRAVPGAVKAVPGTVKAAPGAAAGWLRGGAPLILGEYALQAGRLAGDPQYRKERIDAQESAADKGIASSLGRSLMNPTAAVSTISKNFNAARNTTEMGEVDTLNRAAQKMINDPASVAANKKWKQEYESAANPSQVAGR